MASVLCSAKLHRALAPGGVSGAATGAGDNARLGDWAATLAGREFVVAIEERTCLTLVVRLLPVPGFRDRLAAALRLALGSCGVSSDAIGSECEALERAQFLSRRQPALREAMAFAEMEARAHVEGGQDEASVQDMLNEYPYGECPASCPTEAVAMLFQPRCVLHDTASRIGAPSSRPTRRPAMN